LNRDLEIDSRFAAFPLHIRFTAMSLAPLLRCAKARGNAFYCCCDRRLPAVAILPEARRHLLRPSLFAW
jgi:hypothetical protein